MPIAIAAGRTPEGPFKILDILYSHGVRGTSISMSHVDRMFTDSDASIKTLSELCHRGCYVNHSLFGKECSHYTCNKNFDFPSDAQRIYRIKNLVARGCLDHLLMSHDIVCKNEWTCYGGYGYGHMIEHIVPRLLNRGLDEGTVDRIMKKNPQRWLTCSEH